MVSLAFVRGVQTTIALVVALCSGALYAWAVYSADLQEHFGWTLGEATFVQSAGVFGDKLTSILVGLLLNARGPLAVAVYATTMLSGSYFLLYLMAAKSVTNVAWAAGCYAANGNGSAGFYLLSLYTVSTVWPKERVGVFVALMDVAFSLGQAIIAKAYPLVGSVPKFYLAFAVITLVFGLLMIACHLGLLKGDDEEANLPLVAESGQSKQVADHGATSDALRPSSKPEDSKLPRPSSDSAADARGGKDCHEVIHNPHDHEDKPDRPESMWHAVRTPEFLMLVLLVGVVFPNNVIMGMNLDTVRTDMKAMQWSVADLLTISCVISCLGKLVAGVASDETVNTLFFPRSFYVLLANSLVGVAFAAVAFGPRSAWALLGVILLGGIGKGASPLSAIITKEAFGAKRIGLFLGLYSVVFYFAFVGFSILYVESRERPIVYWVSALAGIAVSTAVSFAVWARDVAHHKESDVASKGNLLR